MMAVINAVPPHPVAEVREEDDLGSLAPFVGERIVGVRIVCRSTDVAHSAAPHLDLRAVNVPGFAHSAAARARRSATAPLPVSTVVYIEQAWSVEEEGAFLVLDDPLVGRGDMRVIAEKGQLSPFAWDF